MRSAEVAPRTAGTAAQLSFQQEELLQQLRAAPECSPSFDNVCAFLLRGPVDADRLAGAVHALSVRHPTLRTTIDASTSPARQAIHRPRAASPLGIDSRGGTLDELVTWLVRDRSHVSDVLAGRRLFRAGLTRTDEGLVAWFGLHHLASDGYSEPVLWRDLSELYNADVERRRSALPRLDRTYAQFSADQRVQWEERRSEVVGAWHAALHRLPAEVRWPASMEDVAPESHDSLLVEEPLDAGLVETVRALAKGARATPFLVLLAVAAAAAARITGQDELLLGSNTANREEPWKQDAVGYYTNTRFTLARVSQHRGLPSLIASLRAQWLAGEEFRDVYSGPLLEALGRPHIVKVDMYDLPREDEFALPGHFGSVPRLTGVETTPVLVPYEIDHWRDLNISWRPTAEGFRSAVRHRLARVDRRTAQALSDALRTVLAETRTTTWTSSR